MQALRAGFEVTGLDFSAAAVAELQTQGINGFVGTLSKNGLGERIFDVITLFHVLEHLADPLGELMALLGNLAPAGALIIQVPNRSSLQARAFSHNWYGLDPPRHLIQFTRRGVLLLLERAGLQIRQAFHFSLRDNAPAIVSSLFPAMDPKARAVRNRYSDRNADAVNEAMMFGLYFSLVALATPLALLEAAMRAGGTLTVQTCKP